MSSVQNGSSCRVSDYGMTKYWVSLESGNYSIKIFRYRFFVGLEFTNSLESQKNGDLASVDFEAFPRGVYFQQPEWTARTVLFPVGFFGDLGWSGGPSQFDDLQSRNVSDYSIS